MTTGTVVNAAALANAFHAANVLTRKHSRTFYFATRLLPPAKRSAIRALYVFCPARMISWTCSMHPPRM